MIWIFKFYMYTNGAVSDIIYLWQHAVKIIYCFNVVRHSTIIYEYFNCNASCRKPCNLTRLISAIMKYRMNRLLYKYLYRLVISKNWRMYVKSPNRFRFNFLNSSLLFLRMLFHRYSQLISVVTCRLHTNLTSFIQ